MLGQVFGVFIERKQCYLVRGQVEGGGQVWDLKINVKEVQFNDIRSLLKNIYPLVLDTELPALCVMTI